MKRFLILIAMVCVATAAVAQKADIAFTVGGSFVSDTQQVVVLPPGPVGPAPTLKTDHHIFFEGTLGARLFDAKLASLHVELPIAGIPSQKLSFSNSPSTAVDHLSTTFVTPSLRLKFAAGAGISPWVSVGGGWAHYSAETAGTSESKAALQYGGGLDFKTGLPLLGFRAEVRDFVTGDPNLVINLANSSGLHHHNVLAGGGIVLRF